MERTQIKNISNKEIDSSFLISGWVEKVRDHGGVIFLDIRDASGLMQVVVEPDDKELFKKSESIRMSYVLEVTGILRERPKGTINESLASGELELVSREINILSKNFFFRRNYIFKVIYNYIIFVFYTIFKFLFFLEKIYFVEKV